MTKPVDVSKGYRTSAGFERADLTDPCRMAEIATRVADPECAWFVARVTPGQEFQVVDRLERAETGRPMFSFAPTREVWRRWNKFTIKKAMRTFPALPGYVVICQPAEFRRQRWARVYACDGVVDVLTAPGRSIPMRVPSSIAGQIVRLSTRANEFEAFMQSGAEFDVGDEVRVNEGPLEGMVRTVAAIHGAEAVVMQEILGAVRRVVLSTRSLGRVG